MTPPTAIKRALGAGILCMLAAACGDTGSQPTMEIGVAASTRALARPGVQSVRVNGFQVEFNDVTSAPDTAWLSPSGGEMVIEVTETTIGQDKFGDGGVQTASGSRGEITFHGGFTLAAGFLRWIAPVSRTEGERSVSMVLRGIDGAEVARCTFANAAASSWARAEREGIAVNVRYESVLLSVSARFSLRDALEGLFGAAGAEIGSTLRETDGVPVDGQLNDAGAPPPIRQ